MLAPREKLWAAPPGVVRAALSLLAVGPGDRLADYGCGDGPALFAAVKDFGAAHAYGYEIHEPRAEALRSRVEAEGLSKRVTVRCANALDADPSEPTCVYLYLISRGLAAVLPLLRRAADQQEGPTKELRVVSVLYRIPGVAHERSEKVYTSDTAMTPVYLYRVTPTSGLAGGGVGDGGVGAESGEGERPGEGGHGMPGKGEGGREADAGGGAKEGE
jgi:hypothetical protein